MKACLIALLLSSAMLAGCSYVRRHEPTTRYEGGFDVQYIADNGDACATVQCYSEGDLCLVTIEPDGPQIHILGRTNSMNFSEKYCSPKRTVILP